MRRVRSSHRHSEPGPGRLPDTPGRPAAARRRLLRGLAAVPLAAAGPAWAAWPAPLLATLRAGGCVVLLRHALTDPGVGDPPGFRLDDCATQRNLSAQGRAQARALGVALADARVPLGPVRSSRWCRCLDTAQLAFGRVEPWPVIDSFFRDRDRESAQTTELRRWAQAWRGPDNAMLVTHQVNVTALSGEFVSMGEALVLRPGADGLRVIGRAGAG
jgi:broad specificity phosphatase PhoE